MNQFCPNCGALFAPDVNLEFSSTQGLCIECGLPLEEQAEVLAPAENDDDQIAYDLIEWPPGDRTIATADLVELGIPYRWEEGVVLVVPASAEEQVDALLDEIDENAEAEPGDDAFPAADDGDGGEEAVAAMGDLFVAADDLEHAEFDEQKVVEFMEATAAVGQLSAPYGIEAQVWARIQKESTAIVDALEKGGDDDAIVEATVALRNLLRQYV
ncbi:MAG TPA: hypothetical protein VHL53_03070 [Acidimicrobiia bacterium]|nr:hypothetical protein [Acidimicrobiia bacterium]